MRDFFDRTKVYWTAEICRRREEAAKEGGEVERLTEKVMILRSVGRSIDRSDWLLGIDSVIGYCTKSSRGYRLHDRPPSVIIRFCMRVCVFFFVAFRS